MPSGAITHPDWDNERIGFQPFPFPSYTEELIKSLRETVVEGDKSFLDDLDPASAHPVLLIVVLMLTHERDSSVTL